MEKEISNEIERLRQLMIQSAKEVGYNHPSVMFFSRKIDSLHNILLASQKEKLSHIQAQVNNKTSFK
jgi:hypothetical protein